MKLNISTFSALGKSPKHCRDCLKFVQLSGLFFVGQKEIIEFFHAYAASGSIAAMLYKAANFSSFPSKTMATSVSHLKDNTI